VRTQHVVLATTISVALLTAISCTRPTAPGSPGSLETGTPARVDIDGPSVVVPNSTAQYRAIAHMTDGSTVDVTAQFQSQWRSSNPSVLVLTSKGTATTRGMGESQITIQYFNVRAELDVLVLQPGTYRVVGTVTESGLPVPGATVDVIESPGTTTSTDASGAYRLYGVAGDIHLRVTKDGYKPLASSLTVTGNQTLDFGLEPVAPPADLTGLYRLTLSGDSCAAPPDERTRTYDAQLTQVGPAVKVVLSGARFAVHGDRGNGFTGRIDPGGTVSFILTGWNEFVYDDVYYNVVEILAEGPPKLLTVSGGVRATVSPTGISGFLDGEMAATKDLGEYANYNWWSCSSRTIQFALQRR
jgi:hypothetical protein